MQVEGSVKSTQRSFVGLVEVDIIITYSGGGPPPPATPVTHFNTSKLFTIE